MTDALKEELRRVMAERHLTQKGWSLAAGLSETYVKDILSGRSSRPSLDGLRKLAKAAGVSANLFLGEGETSHGAVADNVIPALDAPSPARFRTSNNTVPVWGTALAVGGEGDFHLMSGTIIGQAPRFACLEGRPDVRAVYMVGESMAPWRKSGALIYLEEYRAANAGDHVLVEYRTAGDELVSVVRLLVGMTATKVTLAAYGMKSPRKEVELDRKRITRMLRVIEWDELALGR